jgi:nitrite reductase/ring-hydroxylating ferredoxin subunit
MIPPNYERIGTISELSVAGQFTRWVKNHDIVVFRADGRIRAYSNVCPHFGGPIGFHKIRENVFTCLWHNLQYRTSDGQCLTLKFKLREYKTEVENETIYVQLVESDRP